MDKRRIRKFKRMQENIQRVERDYTNALVDAMDSSPCSEGNIASLEESQRVLREEIQKLKRLLDDPFAVDEADIIKTDQPMKPMD